MNSVIIQAIRECRLLEFRYCRVRRLRRVVEPFAYGVFHTGNVILSAYQVSGDSESNEVPAWKLFNEEEVSNLEILSQTFSGIRSGYNRTDSRFSQFYERI